MVRESLKERNRKQKIRQKELRDANRRACRPSRDDMARVALYHVMRAAVSTGKDNPREWLEEAIVKGLEKQGFDARESELLFDRLFEKYKTGAGFLKKRHLQTNTVDIDAQKS